MSVTIPSCSTCVFFRKVGHDLYGWTAGTCHRHAPVGILEPGQGYGTRPIGHWPLVQERDLCGDFKCSTPPTPE